MNSDALKYRAAVMARAIGRKLISASESALRITYVVLVASSQPKVTAAATNALSRPVPARAHRIGVKIAEIILMKRLKRLPFGPSSVGVVPAPSFVWDWMAA